MVSSTDDNTANVTLDITDKVGVVKNNAGLIMKRQLEWSRWMAIELYGQKVM